MGTWFSNCLPALVNYDIYDSDDDEDDEDDNVDDANDNDNEFFVTDSDDTDSASAVNEGSDGLSSGSSDFDNEANESDDDENLSYENEFDHPAVSDEESTPSHDASDDADDEASSLSTPAETTTELMDNAIENVIDSSPTTTLTNLPTTPPSSSGPRRSRRNNAGQGVHRLDVSSRGKYYGNTSPHLQFLQKFKPKKNSPPSFLKQAIDICFSQAEKLPKYSQMNAKRGIREFGEAAVTAMFKEFK